VKTTRKQRSATPAATGDSSKAEPTKPKPLARRNAKSVPVACTVRPQTLAIKENQAVTIASPAVAPFKDTTLAWISNVIPAPPFAALAPTPVRSGPFGDPSSAPRNPFAAFLDPTPVRSGPFGDPSSAPRNPFKGFLQASYVYSGLFGGIPSEPRKSPFFVISNSPSALNNTGPTTLNPRESSSTNAKPTSQNHLLDLPQELQDMIFELAYTEPMFKIIYKVNWAAEQTRLRKRTGKPRVELPPQKVNEWMVSKRYFQAAAEAWVAAQTSLEAVQNQFWSNPDSLDRFPPMKYSRYGSGPDAGLFLDFGRAFIVNFTPYFHRPELILQCRKMRCFVGVVYEEFFLENKRGVAWEVEFTDEELMGVLMGLGFDLPSSVENLFLGPANFLRYADTEEKKAVLNANIANLRRVMWQLKGKGQHPGSASVDHNALYSGSKVSLTATSKELTRPTEQRLFGPL
jgi:hypothetical protein